jgi:hypothetical protein
VDNVAVPQDFVEQLKTAVVKTIGPPPGISREHCVDAQVCITEDWAEDGMGLGWTVFFKPSEEELKHLHNNGLLKVQLRGNGLVPHSLGVW